MRLFAGLFDAIDPHDLDQRQGRGDGRVFCRSPACGRRMGRVLPHRAPIEASGGTAAIQEWTLAATGFERWLLEECWSVVGDGAEIAALVLDQLAVGPLEDLPLSRWVEDRMLPMKTLTPRCQQARVTSGAANWIACSVHAAQTAHGGIPRRRLADPRRPGHRTSGRTARDDDRGPTDGGMDAVGGVVSSVLSHGATRTTDRGRTFCLASPLDEAPDTLGSPEAWLIEWKWDGIRAQLVKRDGLVPPVVSRRGADHAPVPGDRGGRDAAARRHGARRRGPRVSRRSSDALLGPSAAHRTSETGGATRSSGAGRFHDLRPARRSETRTSGHFRFASVAIDWKGCSRDRCCDRRRS